MSLLENLVLNLKRRFRMLFIPVFFSLIVGVIIGGIIFYIKGNQLLSIVITIFVGFIVYVLFESLTAIETEEGLM